MRASWYAKALYALSTSGEISEEKLVTHFTETVSRNGHTHMLHKILRAYERILAKNEKHETIEVTTATPLSEPEVAQLLRSEPFAKLISGTHRRVKRKVDPTIIGGAVARTSTSRTDASHKHMLMQIYQNMTNTL